NEYENLAITSADQGFALYLEPFADIDYLIYDACKPDNVQRRSSRFYFSFELKEQYLTRTYQHPNR
ncbi:hypothetical protein PENTCL1PPCAC_9050, partial [Pristionchus entomophagus]